jgi:hypothetical protein
MPLRYAPVRGPGGVPGHRCCRRDDFGRRSWLAPCLFALAGGEPPQRLRRGHCL